MNAAATFGIKSFRLCSTFDGYATTAPKCKQRTTDYRRSRLATTREIVASRVFSRGTISVQLSDVWARTALSTHTSLGDGFSVIRGPNEGPQGPQRRKKVGLASPQVLVDLKVAGED